MQSWITVSEKGAGSRSKQRMEKDVAVALRSTSLSERNATFHENSWSSLCEKTSPLFQGKGLKGSIDELNSLARKHYSDSANFKSDINVLFQSGVKSLSLKLSNVSAVIPPTEEGDTLYLSRLADIWFYYHNTTLLFLEAGIRSEISKRVVFVPITCKDNQLNIRQIGLVTFKNDLIWPIRVRLEELFSKTHHFTKDSRGKLIQMLSILASITVNEFERNYLVEMLENFKSKNS